ncbi:hypothetical protein D9619_010823 [Psilocybe cf. subviscida]|uniref:Methyltransferase domain-containing protein n=1 Tax=Psilocybe cf. subviscida TaxID=2480587 RepID=A0A8H5B898_9AGAR|nr:hypothetical protein D9619_010823 [Psilocybe cf. subviscida]
MSTSEETPGSDSNLEGRSTSSNGYLLPYNDTEIRRLLEQQKSLSDIYEGRVVIAPVRLKEGSEVLDVGTGAGAWALDFVERYPKADTSKIICIDIGAAMFPKQHPPNITFQITSALAMPAEWTNKFALVHQRLILSGIKYDEWEILIRDIHRITTSGGWAQLCENNAVYDVPGVAKGPATKRLTEAYKRLGELAGLDLLGCAKRIPVLMKAVGFVDIQVEERVTPLGAWNGDIGRTFADNMITVFRGLKAAVLKFGGMGVIQDGEDYDALMDEVEREWAAGPSAHVSWYVIIGRKSN